VFDVKFLRSGSDWLSRFGATLANMNSISNAAKRIHVSFAIMRKQMPASVKRWLTWVHRNKKSCPDFPRLSTQAELGALVQFLDWSSCYWRRFYGVRPSVSHISLFHSWSFVLSIVSIVDFTPDSLVRNPFITQLGVSTVKTGAADIMTQTTVWTQAMGGRDGYWTHVA
jgi:hypothetical protein